jgi:hypothetical protein
VSKNLKKKLWCQRVKLQFSLFSVGDEVQFVNNVWEQPSSKGEQKCSYKTKHSQAFRQTKLAFSAYSTNGVIGTTLGIRISRLATTACRLYF